MDPQIKTFIEDIETRSKEGTASGRKSHARCFDRFLDSRGLSSEEVEIRDIKNYLNHLSSEGYSPSAINGRYWSIKIFYDDLIEDGVLDESPFEDFKRSKYMHLLKGTKKAEYVDEKGGIVALEPEGVEELVENVPEPTNRNELIIRLMYHTGVRRQELADMKVEHVYPNERRIWVYSKKLDSKHYDEDPWRNVWWGKSLDRDMDRWLNIHREGYSTSDSPYLFVTRQSDRISEESINRVVIEAADNAGIQEIMYEDRFTDADRKVNGRERRKITSHTLRHSFARACMTPDRQGARIDIKTLAKLMGHANTSTTADNYLHFAEGDYRDARELYGPG